MVDVRKGLIGLVVAATATAGLAQPGGAQDAARTCKGHAETGTVIHEVEVEGVDGSVPFSDLTPEQRTLWYFELLDLGPDDIDDFEFPTGTPGHVISGRSGEPDVIIGTPYDDVFLGLDKGDIVCGLAGDDMVVAGGAGSLYLGPGDDFVFRVVGDIGRIHGGPGDDYLEVNTSDIVVRGGLGNDVINIFNGADSVVRGGPGRDFITNYSTTGSQRVYGGPNSDLLVNKGGAATILGGTGPDLITNLPNVLDDGDRVVLRGGGGDDAIGGEPADVTRGGPGNDACTGRACEVDLLDVDPDIHPAAGAELLQEPTAWWSWIVG